MARHTVSMRTLFIEQWYQFAGDRFGFVENFMPY